MADSGLEKIGVSVVAEGLAAYQKGMSDYKKSTDDATKATQNYQKQTESAGQKGSGLLGFIKNLVGGLKQSAQAATANIPGFQGLSSAIGGLSSGALVAIGGIALLTAGIFSLGQRGAEVIGIQNAFNNTLGQFQNELGTSTEYLDGLRLAAGDTISELELMRITNIALAGATGEAGTAFGQALPKLLEIARVQAAATGQSVDYLFQSLVTGIKRSSPLLIDNTGLVLKIGEANETYAASIGKTVEELTAQEKQMALINATVEAGNAAIEAAGGVQETAATKMARAMALIENNLNNLSVAVEPILGGILDYFNFVFKAMADASAIVGPILREVVLRIGGLFSSIGQFIQPAAQFIMDTIGNLGQMLVGGIAFFIKGAAAISGAIGNGLLAGANAFVFPAVIAIAQFIADFLSGFSPPKKGPLSTIDKGAANVMAAWTEGFVGAFKPQSIADVAAQVDAQLGLIGSMGIGQVEKRLRQLDKSLRPFQEQLKIVKDNFDALKEPAEAALRAIDRQLERLGPALAAGDTEAAKLTQQLNVQRLAIQKRLDLQQDGVDQAQIQLALQQAQQQQERTLLEIQKARLGTQEKQAKAVKKTVAASGEKAPKPKTGGAAPAPATEAAGGASMQLPGMADSLTNPLAGLDAFGAEVGTEFMDFLSAGGELETFQSNSGKLGEIFAQIGESNPVQGIIGAFDGFGDALQENFVTPISEKITEGVGWFTDPTVEGGLANFFTRIREQGVASVLGDLAIPFGQFLFDSITAPIDALSPLTTLIDAFWPAKEWILGTAEGGGLPSLLAEIGKAFDFVPDMIWSALQSIGLLLWNTLAVPFVEAINTIIDKINEFFGVINNSELVNFARTQLGIQIPEVSFERIDTAAPASLTNPPPPPARKGGLFGGGAVRTHREEVMMGAEPFAVFSQQFVKAMSVLSNAILSGGMASQSLQMPVMASGMGGTTNNSSTIINANMNGNSSPVDIANRIAMERALG